MARRCVRSARFWKSPPKSSQVIRNTKRWKSNWAKAHRMPKPFICASNNWMISKPSESWKFAGRKALTYINAIGGRNLYYKQVFARSGINLFFIQSLPYTYQQRSRDFFPDLSILDVLMNCG